MKAKGQLSFEYLIVLSAFLSALLIMAPFINKVFDLGKHYFEVAQAKSFLLKLKSKADELQMFGQESRIELKVNAWHEWILFGKEKKLFLKIKGDKWIKDTKLEEELPANIIVDFKNGLKGLVFLELTKTSDGIHLNKKN